MNKIIVIAGPTASGKTALGIEVCRAFGGEVISADSMQVYKNMPIATAAPTQEERQAAAHHLVEFLDSSEDFSVSSWCALAREKADDILSRGKVPVIVGGTGLFIDSFVDNLAFDETEIDFALRERLMQRDNDSLYAELTRLDPQAAENIHRNNKKRVVRALELCYTANGKTAQNVNSRREKSPYDFLYLVLEYENRQTLYDRINARVDKMLEQGLEREAREMLAKGGKTSAQAIGHKELQKYFDGEIDIDAAADELKKQTRRYAKRQMTWFRRRTDAVKIPFDNPEDGTAKALKICEDFLYGGAESEKS